MNFELDGIENNGLWITIDLPKNVNLIWQQVGIESEHKGDGSIEKYKVRLATKGYNQVEGLNFFYTFSPIVMLITVRTLMAITCAYNWCLYQIDVNNNLFNGDSIRKKNWR